jgi:tRNA(Ile)-lysidine synthase
MTPLAPAVFATLMAPLGPFEPRPTLAVAVSGGADSMALALLARDWARGRGGDIVALVVDHGLRPEAAAEAAMTCARLADMGIAPRLLTLALAHGPRLAERARVARHAVLAETAAGMGVLHLLFGHHAGDQAETVAMRRLSRSGAAGLAGMAALTETATVRRLRPLLSVPPGALRATLTAAGIGWIEDPSNADPTALRARLRRARGDAAGTGVLTRAAVEAAQARGAARGAAERAVAAELAARVRLHPEGYAVIAHGPLSTPAMAALLRTIAGAPYPPALGQVAALLAGASGGRRTGGEGADNPGAGDPLADAPMADAPPIGGKPAGGPSACGTLAGVRVLPAGRFGSGRLVVREAASMQGPVPARPGVVWDRRFRLGATAVLPEGAEVGALGRDAAALRRLPAARRLPAVVLQALPAIRHDGRLFAVPHLGYPDSIVTHSVPVLFAPASVAACAPFVPQSGVPQSGRLPWA